MSLIGDLLTIVGSPQWNFVYYILVLLALEIALAISYGLWRRRRQWETRRLFAGSLALLLTRLIPLLVSLAPGADAYVPALLPPLERALDVMALTFIGWMFIAPAGGWSAPFLWLNVALAALADAALTRLWMQELALNPTLSYGASWQRYVWTGWQMALCVFLGYRAARGQRYARQAGFLLSLFALAFIGQALEMIAPVTPALFAIWERLAGLAVYTLLAVTVYRIAGEQLSQPADAPLPPANALSLTDMLLQLLADEGAGRKGSESDSKAPADAQSALAGRMARFTALGLGAEQAAIGLVEGEREDRMRLAAIFNPRRRGRGEVVSFPLDEQPAIRRALRQREQVQVAGAEDIMQIKFLYALMGSQETGPILLQPLVCGERAVGVLIAGNAAAKRPFGEGARKLAPALADLIAHILTAPRSLQQAEEKLRKVERTLAEREAGWSQRLDILDEELRQERDNAQVFGQRMTDLEREKQQQQAEIDRLQRRLAQQEEEARRYRQEAVALDKKLESLTVAKLVLEDEIRAYRDQIQNLEQLLSEREESQPF